MVILVFGDSITQGYWDDQGGWAERLRKAYSEALKENSPTFIKSGVAGNSSNEILTRFETETNSNTNIRDQIIFIFAIGINDARIDIDPEVNAYNAKNYAENLAEILKRAKRRSDKIMFVGLSPCAEPNAVASDPVWTNDRIKEFNSILHNFCIQNNVSFVEIFEPFHEVQNRAELLYDGIHPNNDGHQLIASLVSTELQKLLSNSKPSPTPNPQS